MASILSPVKELGNTISFRTNQTPIKKGTVFGELVIYKKAQTTHYKKKRNS